MSAIKHVPWSEILSSLAPGSREIEANPIAYLLILWELR
jgi:hypothetical protein